MKNLNIVFSDEDYEKLKALKGKRSWAKFILEMSSKSNKGVK